MVKIIAIGGGEIGRPREDGIGYYPIETTPIDSEILTLTGKKSPKLLFLPTASYDSVAYYNVVKAHFIKIGFSSVNVLYLSDKTLTQQQIKKTVLSHDAIYVGGGNTLRMMTTWKRLGVDKILKQALDKNIVLAGLSAGSICWFSYGNSDSRKFSSGSNKLIKVTGLGYIDALHCPHYDAEPFRQNDLKRMMKDTSKVAIALDNCSALEVVNNKFRIIRSNSSAKARKIYWEHGKYIVQEISASTTYRNLTELINKIAP
jgi:dipeptidase E